ncbi:MAG: carboxymuconolactone decarboxylase family protein [Gammaproteobacteria bacterium]|nr:carboxymuconolactone decarboxylase family protein [Gammaproteobacteria bacterium]
MSRKLFSLLLLITFTAPIMPLTSLIAAEAGFLMPSSLSATDFPNDIHRDSLARLPQVQRENLDTAGRAAFDTYVSPGTGYGSGLRGPIGVWMNSPELAQAMFDVRQRVRYESNRDQRLTELAIISTAREINNQYEYTAHEPLAIAAGLEQDIIDIVRFRRSVEENRAIAGFGEIEQIIVKFAREVISEDKVSSETFARAIDILGEEGVMDLTGLIGYYSFVAITLKAFDVHRPAGSDLLLPVRIE